jgi:hypothetical protein
VNNNIKILMKRVKFLFVIIIIIIIIIIILWLLSLFYVCP